ncbi:hypothetical protein [Shewanella algae]|uniref:Uncharacterized protein n=2 Tax=Shewanellaceae TaxID=267890 RepID=A0A380BKN9_9GAMM|nr:hypothetical protein [Shewanella algae]MBO2608230.1 hypothetical protein [Shewanella algae]SUJ02046.1 Uncharacterised protein [Shewanella algae]
MQLKDFANLSIASSNAIERLPPTKFFSKLNCTKHTDGDNWAARVNAIKEHFIDITYFQIKGIYRKRGICRRWEVVPSKTFENNQFTTYDLLHGSRYLLKLSIANPGKNSNESSKPTPSKSKIIITDSSGELTLNTINPLETSIQFDDVEIPLTVKTLQINSQASLLSFQPIVEGKNSPIKDQSLPISNESYGEFAVHLDLNLRLSRWRAIGFGLLSGLAYMALELSKATDISDIKWWKASIAFSGISIIAGILYYFYNKK